MNVEIENKTQGQDNKDKKEKDEKEGKGDKKQQNVPPPQGNPPFSSPLPFRLGQIQMISRP